MIFLTPYVLHHPAASDEHMQTEISGVHFPMADAMQLHGPNPLPPEPIEPRGVDFDRRPIRDWNHGRKAEEAVTTEYQPAPEQFAPPPNVAPMDYPMPPPAQGYGWSPQSGPP